jgi:hypothetical protein
VNMPSTDPGSSGLPDLYDLLHFFCYHFATDPRDVDYALLGLSKARDDSRMTIDYSQSVRQVYMQSVDYVFNTREPNSISSVLVLLLPKIYTGSLRGHATGMRTH